VVRTRVGYSGGTKKNPTYHDLGDHSEALRIDYDPDTISYAALLDIFWNSHNPRTRSWSKQYMCALFFHDEDQERAARESLDHVASQNKGDVFTKIIPATKFYVAEDYHQKHRLQNDDIIIRDFRTMYPVAEDFVNSTAAARVNGYLHGYGSPKTVREDLNLLGLSASGNKRLLDIAVGHRASVSLQGTPG
jgi:peptide-methionine (S)-S-oxide reductase